MKKTKLFTLSLLTLSLATTPLFASSYKWTNSTAKDIYQNADSTVKNQSNGAKVCRDLIISASEGFAGNASRIINNVSNDDIHKQAIKDVAVKTEVNTIQAKQLQKAEKAVADGIRDYANKKAQGFDQSKYEGRGNY